jgi:hypothetical protein
VCTVPEATYSTLTQGLDRDRVTILQSLKSLVKYRYIEQKKLSPEHEKSKLIFIPTFKGFSEVWPSVNAKDITNTRKDNEITRYVKFVDQVFSSSQQIEMLQFLFDRLADDYLTDYAEANNSQKNIIKESFRTGIFGLIQTEENMDSQFLSDPRTVEWLKKFYSSKELQELKNHFKRRRDNLIKIIESFPE